MNQHPETPAELGYRWPAEWEPHRATWLSWPHNRETWPGRFDDIPRQFGEMVRVLAEFEPVHVLAGGSHLRSEAVQQVGDLPRVQLFDIPTNDAWCRDHGPTFLVGDGPQPQALIDWEYNAWGGKYPPYDLDNLVPRRIADTGDYRHFRPGIVLEGGAIDGNGQGTVLTTASCLLNPNRNSHSDRAAIEQYLRDYLGARTILWLPRGELLGDDTDGHIDQLARFVGPTTVVAAVAVDSSDANQVPLQENLVALRSMRDAEGRRLEVVALPLPGPKFVGQQRLPASYCNFYIANGLVLVPQFDDPADEVALRVLAELFPDRQVRGFPSLDIVWGLGAMHCLTQQEPAPPPTIQDTLRVPPA